MELALQERIKITARQAGLLNKSSLTVLFRVLRGHRRRKKCFIQKKSRLTAILPGTILKNRMKTSFSFKSSWCNHPIFQIVQCKTASAERNLINSAPQTDATTFVVSSVFIRLLWCGPLPLGAGGVSGGRGAQLPRAPGADSARQGEQHSRPAGGGHLHPGGNFCCSWPGQGKNYNLGSGF